LVTVSVFMRKPLPDSADERSASAPPLRLHLKLLGLPLPMSAISQSWRTSFWT
jgi:hypothetical protein